MKEFTEVILIAGAMFCLSFMAGLLFGRLVQIMNEGKIGPGQGYFLLVPSMLFFVAALAWMVEGKSP